MSTLNLTKGMSVSIVNDFNEIRLAYRSTCTIIVTGIKNVDDQSIMKKISVQFEETIFFYILYNIQYSLLQYSSVYSSSKYYNIVECTRR